MFMKIKRKQKPADKQPETFWGLFIPTASGLQPSGIWKPTAEEAKSAIIKPVKGAVVGQAIKNADGKDCPFGDTFIYNGREWVAAKELQQQPAPDVQNPAPESEPQPPPVENPTQPVVPAERIREFLAQEEALARVRVSIYCIYLRQVMEQAVPLSKQLGKEMEKEHIQTAVHTLLIQRYNATMSRLEAEVLGAAE